MSNNENFKTIKNNQLNIGSSILDFDMLKFQIQTMFSSPNPWSLYSNVKTFKQEISTFINSLTNEIVQLFDMDSSKTSIVKLYIKADYHSVLSAGIQEYVYESKHFDLLFYFYTVCVLYKDKQYLAKALMKMYQGRTDLQIEDFFKSYKTSLKINCVKDLYNLLGIKNLKIDDKYINENEISKFLEKVYLQLDEGKRLIMLDNFKVTKLGNDFEEIYKIFTYIASNYIRGNGDDSSNKSRILSYVNSNGVKEIKKVIDEYIINYENNKLEFYTKIVEILDQPGVQKSDFWLYVKSSIVQKYFPAVKQLFYWELVKNFMPNRLEWNRLSGTISPSDDTVKSIDFYNKCINFRSLIVQLQDNIWWPFLKPIVYRMIIEHLKVDKKSFEKLQFIMCFITARDYSEYRKVYRFFNDIKHVYGLYDVYFSSLMRFVNRLKISFSLVLLYFIVLYFLYFTAPAILFFCISIIGILYFADFVSDDKIRGIEWNTGLRSYLIFITLITGFTWFINLGKSFEQTEDIFRKVNGISSLTLSDVVEQGAEGNLGRYVIDIMNNYNNIKSEIKSKE